MASEAITRNDLTNILNEVLPPTPSEYKKLLWTNPSPTGNFAPQTVALDLSGYDDVEVVANPFGDLQYQYSVTCPVGAGGNLEYQILNTTTATNASTFINGVSRTFRVSTSGITFDNGQMTYNGGAYTNWQGRAIPYKIYGIKYERVAPPQMEVPMVAYNDSFVGSSGTISKTHTIADNGLYLILARANANSGSAVPAVRIYINNVIQAQNADAGGSTMTYHLATLSAGDIVKGEFSATNAEASQSSWNNLAIIRLGSTS